MEVRPESSVTLGGPMRAEGERGHREEAAAAGGGRGRVSVLTVQVRGDLHTVGPVGALPAQRRPDPTGVEPVGADVGRAEVAASGRDVDTDEGALDAVAGGGGSINIPAGLKGHLLPPPHSPQPCGVQQACGRPLGWVPPQDQVHVGGGQPDVGGSVDGGRHHCPNQPTRSKLTDRPFVSGSADVMVAGRPRPSRPAEPRVRLNASVRFRLTNNLTCGSAQRPEGPDEDANGGGHLLTTLSIRVKRRIRVSGYLPGKGRAQRNRATLNRTSLIRMS